MIVQTIIFAVLLLIMWTIVILLVWHDANQQTKGDGEMTLICYKNDKGKIVRYHLPPKDMTPKQLEEAVASFNEKNAATILNAVEELKAESEKMKKQIKEIEERINGHSLF